MNRNKRQIFTICKQGRISLIAGILSILFFAIIYFLLTIKTKETYFYSFFFHNIRDNILLMILSLFHVSLLGLGILLLMIAFFKKSPLIKIYSDRFELSDFLSKTKVIYYRDIKRITQSTVLVRQFDLSKYTDLNYRMKKRTLIFFENPTYSFYLSYVTDEYSDDIKVIRKSEQNFLARSCTLEKYMLKNILKIVKKGNSQVVIPTIL